jgi:hypothetical protein
MMYKAVSIFFILAGIFEVTSTYSPAKYTSCNGKDFGHGIVCVCSEQHCDQFDSEGAAPLKHGQYAVYTSSKAGARFNLTLGAFNDKPLQAGDGLTTLTLNESVTYQSILGFGGAFTGRIEVLIVFLSHQCHWYVWAQVLEENGSLIVGEGGGGEEEEEGESR